MSHPDLPTYLYPIAERIARRFGSGQCWRLEDGTSLADAIAMHRHTRHWLGAAQICEFADGSAIALTDGGWDRVARDDDGVWRSVEADGSPNPAGWALGGDGGDA